MTDAALEIRRSLLDPYGLCNQLDLLKDHKRQATGVLICCPAHGDKSPSCSVTLGPDGTIRVHCFSCDFSTDAIGLIAQVHGLSTTGPEFLDVLRKGSELAALSWLVDELSTCGARPVSRPDPKPAPAPQAPAQYPDTVELVELWETATSVADDTTVSGYLVGRALDPDVVAAQHLARAIGPTTKIPRWGAYQSRSWQHTGHRLLVPVWDHQGAMRSVRGCRVTDGDTPKRLPPAGCKASELVLCNHKAVSLLRRTDKSAQQILFVEGEPDFLTMATRTDLPVFGVLSGAWNQSFANRIPKGSDAIVITHADEAGERYAKQITESVSAQCQVWRRTP